MADARKTEKPTKIALAAFYKPRQSPALKPDFVQTESASKLSQVVWLSVPEFGLLVAVEQGVKGNYMV